MGTDFSQKLPMPGGVKVNKDNQYYDERELDEDEVIFNGRYLKDLILETSFKISNYFNLIDLSNMLRRSPIAIGSTVFISIFILITSIGLIATSRKQMDDNVVNKNNIEKSLKDPLPKKNNISTNLSNEIVFKEKAKTTKLLDFMHIMNKEFRVFIDCVR